MDDNPLSPGVLPGDVNLRIIKILTIEKYVRLSLFLFIVLLLVRKAIVDISVTMMYFCTLLSFRADLYLPDDRLKTSIAFRFQVVTDIYVREMDKLLALMKLWESRSCRKVDVYRNYEYTMTRLRRFLNAMGSPDLANKISESKDLSGQLISVTKRLIWYQLFMAIDPIPIILQVLDDSCLYLFPVSEG